MRLPFRLSTGLLALAVLALGACSSDDPVEPTPTVDPPLGLSVSTQDSKTLRISFSGRAEDDSYSIERAEGASGGTFTQLTTVTAPVADGVVTYDDTNLPPNSTYRYRVSAKKGSLTSTYTSEVSGTTGQTGVFSRTVTQDITTSTTWYRDTVYTLGGFIHVANGATLTIEAGTKIVGSYDVLGASLWVLRGAKIMAVGTADLPIVFTSAKPVGQRQPGDWGGLIIVGNAIDARVGVDIEIEGSNTVAGTTSGTNYQVLYSGGTNNADNSGELRYVRVEFAGYAPSLNNELNSYSLAAVGSGTRLSYLEAMAGLDDAYEFWGGAVNGDHLISYETGDDHFDMSEGYVGKLQYLIAVQTTRLTQRTGAGSPASDPEGIENDGCQGSGCANGWDTAPYTLPVVANFTLVGMNDVALAGSSGGIGMMIRRGSGGYYVNGIVARWPRAGVSIRDNETYSRAGNSATPNLATADLALRNILFLENNATLFQTGTGQNAFDLAGNALDQNAATLASQFTAFPATINASTTTAAFDWTPAAGSAAASGGLATFTGKLATAAGTLVSGTSYRGAADPTGAKWWAGWSVYAQQ